jgi:hypothetical protein
MVSVFPARLRQQQLMLILAASLLSGCGGRHEHVFTGEDAKRLANVPPTAPGWNWPSNKTPPVWDTSSTGPPTTDVLLRKFRLETAGLASIGEASKHWQDANKLGNLDIGAYKDSSDAHKTMAPFNALSEGWGAQTGRIAKATQTTGLGDESWVMWVQGNGPQVTYHWRRDNLVFEVHVHCFGRCPSDVDPAPEPGRTRSTPPRLDICQDEGRGSAVTSERDLA